MSQEEVFSEVFHEWVDLFMHRSMRRFLNYARQNGLSMSMIGALFHLNRHGNAGVTDLGHHLGVSSPAVSQMLDRLIELGLIHRTEDPDDRRMKRVALTDEGCRILEEGIRIRKGWLLELAESFTDQEQAQLTECLALMIKHARQLD